MPEDNKKTDFTKRHEETLRNYYAEAKERSDQLKSVNVENQEFYEGRDAELERRKDNAEVERSAVFVHELKPAIDTRVASAVAKVEKDEYPVKFRPKSLEAAAQDRDQTAWITKQINEQMRDCGYMSDGFSEHILGAEIYRTPSTVKVGWEFHWEKEAVTVNPFGSAAEFIRDAVLALSQGRRIPSLKPKVRYEDRYKGGRPYAQWLSPETFLYEPGVSNFHKDSMYVFNEEYVTFNKLMSLAHHNDWDHAKLKANEDDLKRGTGELKDSVAEEVQSGKGEGTVHGYRDDKILIAEGTIVTYEDDGRKKYNDIVFIADKYLVFNEPAAHELVGFPYVPITANRMPGTIEALSSIDICKDMQRLYNEVFNSWLDYMTYRIFPPFKVPMNFRFKSTPIYGPGRFWYCTDPDALQSVIENPGSAPELVSLMGAVASNIRRTLAASDTQQGFNQSPHEKATVAKLRFASSAQRSVPVYKDYGMAIVSIADMFMKLNQQHNPDPHNYVINGGVLIDVPSLTSVSDPESEKQDALFLYQSALSNPIYANPSGQIQIRNMWEKVVRLISPYDVDDFVPTEEEIKQQLTAALKGRMAVMDKASIMEQMSLENNQAQQITQPQEAPTNA